MKNIFYDYYFVLIFIYIFYVFTLHIYTRKSNYTELVKYFLMFYVFLLIKKKYYYYYYH